MRRHDREVTDMSEIVEIISQCFVCRIALNGDDGYPYILPLNFGYTYIDGMLRLYFHSALNGKKHDLIASDTRACFEMDCNHTLLSVAERGYCTMNYESVIGQGKIDYILDPQQKADVLTLMTDRYHTEHFEYNPAAIERTSVYQLTVHHITAKRKASKP